MIDKDRNIFSDEKKEAREMGALVEKINHIESTILVSLNDFKASFADFKRGVGERLEVAEKELIETKTKLKLLLWVMGIILTPVLAGVGYRLAGK
jgi:hypothetical protein